MITAFLFYGKLVKHEGVIDWRKLYAGRVSRLLPMYLVTVAILVAVVFAHSGFNLVVSPLRLAHSLLNWGAFTILGTPLINDYEGTRWVVAGVTWTLRYEWLFYFSLPVVAVLLRFSRPQIGVRVTILSLLATIIAVLPTLSIYGLNSRLLLPFITGMIAYELASLRTFGKSIRSNTASTIVAALIVLAVISPFPKYSPVSMIILSVAFAMIASGNAIFGLLEARASTRLGEPTYSIYLIHGIILHAVFQAIVASGFDLSEPTIWLLLPVCLVLVTAISFVAFEFIERPFMRKPEKRVAAFADVAP